MHNGAGVGNLLPNTSEMPTMTRQNLPFDASTHPVGNSDLPPVAALTCLAEGLTEPVTLKIVACLSAPRLGWQDHQDCDRRALGDLRIPTWKNIGGAYWHHAMQAHMQQALDLDIDILLTLDFDSMFTAQHVSQLLGTLASRPDMDAICANQAGRSRDTPLVTIKDTTRIEDTYKPIKVNTAHFGLTAIRVAALKDVPKPWLINVASPEGNLNGPGSTHPDIYFWRQWEKAGKTVYLAPDILIGHLETVVSEFVEVDGELVLQQISVKEWIEREYGDRKEDASASGTQEEIQAAHHTEASPPAEVLEEATA